MTEGKTLKELNVKPGDVVKYIKPNGPDSTYFPSTMQFTIAEDGRVKDAIGLWWNIDEPCHQFRIISRASETPKLWRDMTPEEKGALLLAYHEGKVIESHHGDMWRHSVTPAWFGDSAYRIRPEPKVETHTHVVFAHGESRGTTYNTIDGNVDWTSFKVMGK